MCAFVFTDKIYITASWYLDRWFKLRIHSSLSLLSQLVHVCLSHHSGGYHTAGRATQETATGSGGGHEEHLGSKVQGTVSLLEQPHVPAIDSTHRHCNDSDSDSDWITRSPAILANIDTSTTVLLLLSTHLSVCLSVCRIQEVSMSVRLSVCVYAYLSFCLSLSLSLTSMSWMSSHIQGLWRAPEGEEEARVRAEGCSRTVRSH